MNKPNITPALKSAVSAYLLARTYAETMEARVQEVYREILTECPVYEDRTGKQILDSHRLYLCNDEDLIEDALMVGNHRLREQGIKPDDMGDEHCPALVAECVQRDATRLLIKIAAETLIKEDGEQLDHNLICAGLEKRQQFVDLVVGLVVNYGNFKNPLTHEVTP